jgi:hypothetical protein
MRSSRFSTPMSCSEPTAPTGLSQHIRGAETIAKALLWTRVDLTMPRPHQRRRRVLPSSTGGRSRSPPSR